MLWGAQESSGIPETLLAGYSRRRERVVLDETLSRRRHPRRCRNAHIYPPALQGVWPRSYDEGSLWGFRAYRTGAMRKIAGCGSVAILGSVAERRTTVLGTGSPETRLLAPSEGVVFRAVCGCL